MIRPPHHPRSRRGATAVESAVVFVVFFTLVMGMLDLGIGVFRYHAVSAAARHGARQAIVHGSAAPAAMGSWGPTTIDTTADATGVPLVDAVKPLLVGFDRSQTRVRAEWVDGGNDINQRVRVTISAPYRPVVTFLFGNTTINLSASSTMPIAH